MCPPVFACLVRDLGDGCDPIESFVLEVEGCGVLSVLGACAVEVEVEKLGPAWTGMWAAASQVCRYLAPFLFGLRIRWLERWIVKWNGQELRPDSGCAVVEDAVGTTG